MFLSATKEFVMNKSPSSQANTDRYERLLETVSTDDIVGIPIVADPDAIASAMTLKRLLWRKVQETVIYRVNAIRRSDNLAMLRDLKITVPYINQVDTKDVTKWALVDAQPHHHKSYGNIEFTIIIDHHPLNPELTVPYMDIREEYGAVSSIMTEYLREATIEPARQLATALFYGIKSDTNNFTRKSTVADIEAFRYLYPYVNLNIIKRIQSSEINKKNLEDFREAFARLQFFGDTAYIHMGVVNNTDALVILADFFLKMAEAFWCIVSGFYGKKLVMIIRYAGFRCDAGKVAGRLFGKMGSAGGHKSAARVEIPLAIIESEAGGMEKVSDFLVDIIKNR